MKFLNITINLIIATATTSTFLAISNPVQAYPLDGLDYTGIQRLEGYRLGQLGKARAKKLPSGALLNLKQVQPRLLKNRGMQIPTADKKFSQEVKKLLRSSSKYGIAVLDLTDLKNPLYAEHNAERSSNPGSVGKLAVAMAVFNALKESYPSDIKAREKVLKNAMVVADRFIVHDSHTVPFWQPAKKRILKRRLRIGDTASLWSYLDYMLSPSSNAAASMVMKHMMLLKKFRKNYPVSRKQEDEFFKGSRKELSEILRTVLDQGVAASGLDPTLFRQGGFFTSGGKKRVSGGGSTGTPRELLKFLFNLERGLVIDQFSSREIKRLIYMTQRRIRYASAPALKDSAVYFKSGSLYRCRAEVGFSCRKYRGNVTNLLNSVATVETKASNGSDGKPRHKALFYMVAITSNVLKHNAAVDHQTLATRLHRLMQKRHEVFNVKRILTPAELEARYQRDKKILMEKKKEKQKQAVQKK